MHIWSAFKSPYVARTVLERAGPANVTSSSDIARGCYQFRHSSLTPPYSGVVFGSVRKTQVLYLRIYITMSGLEKALFNLKASLSVPIMTKTRLRSVYHRSVLGCPPYVFSNNSFSQFTAKQLNRQAAKASKDEKTEKDKLKKVRSTSLSGHPE